MKGNSLLAINMLMLWIAMTTAIPYNRFGFRQYGHDSHPTNYGQRYGRLDTHYDDYHNGHYRGQYGGQIRGQYGRPYLGQYVRHQDELYLYPHGIHHAYGGLQAYNGHHAYSGTYGHQGRYEDNLHHGFRSVHGHFSHMRPWNVQGIYWPYLPNDDQNDQGDSDYNKGMNNGQEGNLNEDGEDIKAGPVVQEGQHAANSESQREGTANTQVGQTGQEEEEKVNQQLGQTEQGSESIQPIQDIEEGQGEVNQQSAQDRPKGQDSEPAQDGQQGQVTENQNIAQSEQEE
ncbi:hypothetical protein LSH36_1862g00010 [Paralvinella palmiformis]|uniref:Uncharacterized protein n=1 Tax=Paralvinella palmiformis TaxID=53620 RepID=A0AAD9MQK9_9ANNE|nr:hypothetical protein LSH36_1862g00010 [Paralvinella palmiformis]